MKPIITIAFFIAITVAAGCAPSQQQFEAERETLRGSVKAQQYAFGKCLTNGWNSRALRAAALLLDTTEKAAPRLACTRVMSAMKSGRLEYADAVAFKQGRPTPEMIKILQGR